MICQKLCAQNESVLNTIWKKYCWKCQVCCRCDFGPRKKIRIYCLVDSFVLSLKRKSRCFDKFFIICCTCRNGKFRCSKWRNFVIADSVIWHEHQDSSLLEGFRNMCLYTFTLYPRKARHQMALSVSVSWLFGVNVTNIGGSKAQFSIRKKCLIALSHEISGATRLAVVFLSLWNLAGGSAAALPKRLSNFRAIDWIWVRVSGFEIWQDFSRIFGNWIGLWTNDIEAFVVLDVFRLFE